MTHPTDETLNDYIELELSPAEQVRVATHLETCDQCAPVVADIQYVVREAAALGPITPPPHVWGSIQARVARGSWTRFGWAAAAAALIVTAILAERFLNVGEQQRTLTEATGSQQTVSEIAIVRERVLLVAVGDHLERSQMVLVELAHAETQGELDISAERQLADDLVASNRLYRQTAQQMGQTNVAGILNELEPVLVEVARGPSTVSMQQLASLQQRIESQGILFKMKIVGSDIREQPVS